MKWVAVMLPVLSLSFAGEVQAQRQVDHRYTVQGFVLDAEERPIRGITVTVRAEGAHLGSRTTDRRGYYRVQLHLHNSDLGRTLEVTAGDARKGIVVDFDPGDLTTERVHDLNFIGGSATESALGFQGFPTWAYMIAGVIVLLVAGRSVGKVVKRRRRKRAKR